jgi:hypothetical protein
MAGKRIFFFVVELRDLLIECFVIFFSKPGEFHLFPFFRVFRVFRGQSLQSFFVPLAVHKRLCSFLPFFGNFEHKEQFFRTLTGVGGHASGSP